ncbi:hypothetical protein D3C75_1130440 [compost metagenome]
MSDTPLIVITDPIGEPVTKEGTSSGGSPNRPEGNAALANQRPQPQQNNRGRQQQREEGQRLAKRQEEDDRDRPGFMLAHCFANPVNHVIEVHNLLLLRTDPASRIRSTLPHWLNSG